MTLRAEELMVAGRLGPVSATLAQGEITAICGPNGAGKSTLLGALAGLLPPDAGGAYLAGRPIHSYPPKARAQAIGYLPQNGQAAWDVAVRNIVALGRMPHGDMARAPVDAALDALGLMELAARPVSQLSGGEKARVFLARVLAGEPEWILADEPLAALDLAHQHVLIGHLRRAANSGNGVAVVLHDLAVAMNHADRVLVLQEGTLVADGPPATALSADVIKRVWGVDSQWIGEDGARALITRPDR